MTEKTLLFDSHCHLDDGQFDQDRQALLDGLPALGIAACLTCGSDLTSSKASLALTRDYPYIYAAAGIHPHEAAKAQKDDLLQIAALLDEEKVVALGEIGLDFYYDFSPRALQEELLNKQLDLALEENLPVVLHVREAHGAMIDLLKRRKDPLSSGILHCFSGSAQSAQIYMDLGFHISFAGSLTFKNAHNLRQAAEAVHMDRLLIETDSPYLAPVPFRGKRNDPSKVLEVCRLLAEIKGVSVERMARTTLENTCKLLNIPLARVLPNAD